MQTFSLVLDDASLLWVVVCLYSICLATDFIQPVIFLLGRIPLFTVLSPSNVFMEAFRCVSTLSLSCHPPSRCRHSLLLTTN
ncbi:hypothetical protein B0H14DRAFT_2885964, partial [Mycena olivaceomarginata]